MISSRNQEVILEGRMEDHSCKINVYQGDNNFTRSFHDKSYWSISTLASSLRETCCCATSNLPLEVTNEGREAIKTISGAVAGDSSLQDRGVAHYLLSLLFSLVSLSFSFYFCVPYQKYQKYLLLPWVPMKTPSCVTSLVTTTMTLSALLLLHLPLQHLPMKLNLLY